MSRNPNQTAGHCRACGRHLDVPRSEARLSHGRGFCVNSACKMAWTLQPLRRPAAERGAEVEQLAAKAGL